MAQTGAGTRGEWLTGFVTRHHAEILKRGYWGSCFESATTAEAQTKQLRHLPAWDRQMVFVALFPPTFTMKRMTRITGNR